MLDRLCFGKVPRKHHIVCRDTDGALLFEECITREGFDGPYTIVYHRHRPHTARVVPARHGWQAPQDTPERPLARRHYQSQAMPRASGPLCDVRTPMLFNADVVLGVAFPDVADPVYFSNGDADELFYVLAGEGIVRTPLGDLRYGPDDYVCIPKGILYRLIPQAGVAHHLLTIECTGGVGLLPQWRNALGQLRMDAPYCHRDFRHVDFQGPQDEGIREVVVKRQGRFHGLLYDHSPLDIMGWDGTVYPWAFPILNFQPRAGLVHLPPTWHGTFATRGALICSFVPRMVDFHPESIPCPYPHASVDCDEFLFYCRGNFTSRKGVGPGSMSHHPSGLAHGPHPGSYEKSIGERETRELAVMLDTFLPLQTTAAAQAVEDGRYHDSFIS